MDDLRKCPFCGSSDIRICTIQDDNPRSESGEWITVGCYDCGTMAQLACLPGTKDESIEQWNTRPLEDALAAEITKLEHIIDDREETIGRLNTVLNIIACAVYPVESVGWVEYVEADVIRQITTIAREARTGY